MVHATVGESEDGWISPHEKRPFLHRKEDFIGRKLAREPSKLDWSTACMAAECAYSVIDKDNRQTPLIVG
jgi:hypothetical protein